MATIKSKIFINVIIVLITVGAIVGMNYADLRQLAVMQDDGAKRSNDALLASAGARVGLSLYAVIADAVINRKLEESAKVWAETKERNLKRLDDVIKIADTSEEKQWANDAKKAADEIVRIFETKTVPLLKGTEGISNEIKEYDELIDKHVKSLRENMLRIDDSIARESQAADAKFDKVIKHAIIKALSIGVIGILLQVGLAGWLLHAIIKPLDALRLMLMDISQGEGDLTKRLDDGSGDELGEISRYFNKFVNRLHNIVVQVAQTSDQVSNAAALLNAAAAQIATGAEEVAAQSGTVATAGEEMSATSSEIARNCLTVAEASNHANEAANESAYIVMESVNIMNAIAERVKESAETVASLGQRSDQIGAIVSTIEDIADQTNLLALNAAIEAARAGEQGRGFAVVADEVRALAERTTRATREISEMIKTIQAETGRAVSLMDSGVAEVEHGVMESARSSEALMNVLSQIGEVSAQVNQIATAAEEQTATTGEISSNMQQISQVVQQTSHGAHESATAAAQLSSSAEQMQRLVRQFKL